MAHVFISYAHADADFAELLQNRLEKAGFEVWIDSERLELGEEWRQQIDDAIKNSFGMVCILSPDATDSKYVTYEWAFAYGLGIKSIPIMLKTTELHPRLETFQYLDFTNRLRPWDKLTARLKKIQHNRAETSKLASLKLTTPAIKLALSTEMQKLLNELNDHFRGARIPAMKLLVEMDHLELLTEEFVSMLRREGEENDIRILAAQALGKINDPKTFLDLVLVLDTTSDFELLCAIVETLGKIPDERVIQHLERHLYNPPLDELYSDEKHIEYKEFILYTLHNIGSQSALSVIQKWLGG